MVISPASGLSRLSAVNHGRWRDTGSSSRSLPSSRSCSHRHAGEELRDRADAVDGGGARGRLLLEVGHAEPAAPDQVLVAHDRHATIRESARRHAGHRARPSPARTPAPRGGSGPQRQSTEQRAQSTGLQTVVAPKSFWLVRACMSVLPISAVRQSSCSCALCSVRCALCSVPCALCSGSSEWRRRGHAPHRPRPSRFPRPGRSRIHVGWKRSGNVTRPEESAGRNRSTAKTRCARRLACPARRPRASRRWRGARSR